MRRFILALLFMPLLTAAQTTQGPTIVKGTLSVTGAATVGSLTIPGAPSGVCAKADGTGYTACVGASGTFTNINGGSSLSSLSMRGMLPITCTDSTGSGVTQTCTTTPSFTITNENCFVYETTTSNSGFGLTLNVNSIGASNVAIPGPTGWTTTLPVNIIPANKPMLACYDGVNINVMGTGATPLATNSSFGIVSGDDNTLTISSGVISCTTASLAQVGCVKPDGTTITISGGVISMASGAGCGTHLTTGMISSDGNSGTRQFYSTANPDSTPPASNIYQNTNVCPLTVMVSADGGGSGFHGVVYVGTTSSPSTKMTAFGRVNSGSSNPNYYPAAVTFTVPPNEYYGISVTSGGGPPVGANALDSWSEIY